MEAEDWEGIEGGGGFRTLSVGGREVGKWLTDQEIFHNKMFPVIPPFQRWFRREKISSSAYNPRFCSCFRQSKSKIKTWRNGCKGLP